MTPESGLIAVVTEAELLLGPLRARFYPSAAIGVPAHITVLYPFRPPGKIDRPTLESLRECFSRMPAIDFELKELRRFGDETLYLKPDPGEPFRQLTFAVWELFPETPPYGGIWPDVVPHLSVAQAVEAGELDRIARELGAELAPHLPIRSSVSEVALIENMTGHWTVRTTFPLRG